MNKTTFSSGPDGLQRVATVVFYTDKGSTESRKTAPGQDIGEMLLDEFSLRTGLPALSWERASPGTATGQVVYALHFHGGSTQVVTVLI